MKENELRMRVRHMSSRDAVETAIDMARADKTSTWESLAQAIVMRDVAGDARLGRKRGQAIRHESTLDHGKAQ